MTLTQKLQIIVEALKKYDAQKILLFGSLAKGNADEYSDIDILVIKKTDKPFVKRLREVALLCKLDEPIDILVYTPEEIEEMKKAGNFFIESVFSEGRVLYER